MKKLLSLILSALLLTAALPAAAVSDTIVGGGDNSIEASHQIASYSVDIIPRGSGRVEVITIIVGTHRQMTRIGLVVASKNNKDIRTTSPYC
jgi:hypothetical protein